MSYEYALFVFEQCEGGGGWNDFVGCFATVEEAMEKGKAACRTRFDEAHIVHLAERRIILRGGWNYIRSTLTGQPGTTFYEWTAADESERASSANPTPSLLGT